MAYVCANVAGRATVVVDGRAFDVERMSGGALGSDLMSVLARPDDLAALAASVDPSTADGMFDAATAGVPVPRPSKVFGIGLNYRSHAEEANMEVPDNPVVFTKWPNCICAPNADIQMRSDRCDYEGELVVVIGRGGKDIAVADAWDHVFGYTVGQDISDRAVQLASKPPHFNLGKSFDTFGPIGPVIVPVANLDDPNSLRLRTLVNDEVRQDDDTKNLIFDVPTLVHYLSRITTLEPGDLIFTGTPSGVGMVQKKWLADGDVITTEIEGVGTIVNRCVRVSDHQLPLQRRAQ